MKYIKPYNLYESRREVLAGNLANILEEYVPWYDLDSNIAIYRGVKHSDKRRKNQDFYIIDTSVHTRYKSFDSDGLHNIIIDNSVYWKDFPIRAKSLIGTTDRYKAEGFGELYRLIPLNEKSIFAVSPESDLFKSLYTLREIDDDFDTLGDLQEHIENTFDIYDKNIQSYNELEKYLTSDNLLIEEDNTLSRTSGFGGLTVSDVRKIEHKYGSFLKYIEAFMKPYENDFEVLKYNELATKMSYGHEVWTEGKCIMIREDLLS